MLQVVISFFTSHRTQNVAQLPIKHVSPRTTMALVRYIGRIWPTLANVLYNAMRHNLPHIINHAPEFLFQAKVCRVFPQATVLQGTPEPLIILAAFCVVRKPRFAASHVPECLESDTRRLQTKITGRHIDSTGSGLLSDFSYAGCSTSPLEEAYWRQWRQIFIPWYGKTFVACEEKQNTVFSFSRANSEEIWKYFLTIAFPR